MRDSTGTGKQGISITAAARSLKINRMVFYGVMLAYGIVPEQAEGRGVGRPPKVISPGQLEHIRRRLNIRLKRRLERAKR